MAKAGSILVKNTGWFVAHFSVQYMQQEKELTVNSGNITAGLSKALYIPPDATNIFVKIQEEYFIASWSTVGVFNFDQPVVKCYEVYGTTLSAKVKEVACPGS
ncbi:hypothetical protein EST62_12980 [Chlorobaculum sp. 24CR]|jgi:hypothetical protein|uniref:thiol-activated cytolysin C-terminal domain-containing protein n=1 Tax=Chlorobaculum sp. 24CR TaxID=2508878 RepID=UPI00100A4660|nr:thiol-activated cytolysin C-terminal domain-containing protein [Chlorobaculum sp. 24CR]RXK80015.1 hypothetical protein EST62_12980 [Chlorobaculum sp. 24CR]